MEDLRKCAVCEYVWKAHKSRDPKRCPNPDCRSLRWRDGVDGRKQAAETPVEPDYDWGA